MDINSGLPGRAQGLDRKSETHWQQPVTEQVWPDAWEQRGEDRKEGGPESIAGGLAAGTSICHTGELGQLGQCDHYSESGH